ncbi:AMP-binding protein [Candidatus Skiveiella danica]|jgi:long-chain acyl-CoA synthetase|uniref:AMP-binding protein n=1 Tax=Candidatus Skiveiella danica TaxID=3386177 RepID=UPI0009CAEECE|nr:MAG: Long-chain-fatty-acid--CoA ligase FadD15 [Alphaproteobacteria bacterium ADurb.Bin100]
MASSARPETLALQRLYQWEQTTPDKTVFTQPMGGGVVREWTWKQAVEEVRRMAAYLKGLNLEPGTRIALLAKNSAHWMMADWAIWMAGHVSVPLYPTLAANTVRQILDHSESKLLFVGKLDVWNDMKAGVPEGLPMITLPLAPKVDAAKSWDALIAGTAPLADSPVRPADELCTLIYTSGTTGMPKGVMQTFGTFAWSITSGLKRVPLDQNGRVLSFLPLAHVAERMVVEHGLLATGMHVFFAESLETFVSDIQRARPTVFFAVPRLWVKFQQGVQAKMPPEKMAMLLKIPILRGIVKKKVLAGLGLDQVFWAAGGAAPMPPSVLDWYRSLGLDIVEVYGMTENCGLSHSTVLGKPRPGTVGTTYEGVQCRIDPGNGEIQVKGECVMLGYYKNPEVTAATFTDDGWLKTGDKGAIDSAGDLRITGRVKDLFKTGKGKYVAPAPIENKLATHPAIEACCVTGANLGQPLALLMLNPEAAAKARDAAGRSALEASLAEHLKAVNAQLDPHEQMECLVVTADPWSVENDILTPTMKVKRNKIEDLFAQNYERWATARKKVVWI